MNTWAVLIPLVIGSVISPTQTIVTILLLRSSHGKITAVAWVAGMAVVRLLQGLLVGLVFGGGSLSNLPRQGDTTTTTAAIILLAGVLMLAYAARGLVHQQDPDAPPPRWLNMTETMRPVRAFALGAVLIAVGARAWVFTFGAAAAIGDGGHGYVWSTTMFCIYVALCLSPHIAAVTASIVAPHRADPFLRLVPAWLTAHSRIAVIVLEVCFGVFFVGKGLVDLGLL